MNTLDSLKNVVISTNVCLREVVSTMDPIILLRNCHPNASGDFANQLAEEGVITKDQAREFTKVALPSGKTLHSPYVYKPITIVPRRR